MKKEKIEKCVDCECKKKVEVKGGGGSCPIYGIGVIGALVYYLQGVSGFMNILTGVAKAVFWPAVLMYELLSFLQL